MRPKYEEVVVQRSKLGTELLQRSIGNVFHVTSREGLAGIEATGAILANEDGSLGDTFPQSKRSYFRSQGCVCLFDLRHVSEEELKNALDKYYFLNPHHVHDNPVFLILREQFFSQLRPWSEAKRGVEMVIPHVECGFTKEVSLDMIQEVLIVRIEGPHGYTGWLKMVAAAEREREEPV